MNTKRTTLVLAALLAHFATLTVHLPCARAAATIYDLGTLGGTFSNGSTLNASGQVAGRSDTTGDSALHAFLYTGAPGSGGAMADLGTLGGGTSYANALNASGQVAGSSYMTGAFDGATHAFLYTGTPGSGGAMADLGTLGGTTSFGNAINASAQVAGYSYTTGNSAQHAFLYTGPPGRGGSMADLGTLGGSSSQGFAINGSGQVAGQSDTTGDSALHAFLYSSTPGNGGSMADLGTLGGGNSQGSAINASGQVAGESDTTGNSTEHAFLYTGTPGSGGSMADLGTLGGTFSFAIAINASGQVAGGSNTSGDSAQHAFLYTGTPGVDGQMIDLDAWLDANNPTEGAKWTLRWASGLTDTGLITGFGDYNDGPSGLTDGSRAFLLDASDLVAVPEPSTFALAGLGFLGLVVCRQCRRCILSVAPPLPVRTSLVSIVPASLLCLTLLAAAFAPRPAQAGVLLVGNLSSNTVGEYNVTTGATIQTPFITSTSGTATNFMALDGSNHLFVSSNSGKNIVGEYDAITGATIRSDFINGQGLNSPGPVALDGSNHLFVASGGSPGGMVGEYDATTGATIKSDFININQGLNTAEAMALDRPNNHLFVVDFNDVREFDATTGASIKYSFIHAGSPSSLAVDGLNHLFLATAEGNEVQEYDATTGALIKNFITGLNYPWGLALDGNNHLFVSDAANSVGEYNATTGATINATLISGQGLNWPGDMVFASSVPEPSTFMLAGICLLSLLTCIRQRRRRTHLA